MVGDASSHRMEFSVSFFQRGEKIVKGVDLDSGGRRQFFAIGYKRGGIFQSVGFIRTEGGVDPGL